MRLSVDCKTESIHWEIFWNLNGTQCNYIRFDGGIWRRVYNVIRIKFNPRRLP